MIENNFFDSEEIKEIVLQLCTSKIEDVVKNDPKNMYFICLKAGYEGIFMKNKLEDAYYIPLLSLRNNIKQIVIEEQNIKVILLDEEFFVIGFPPEKIDLTFKKFKDVYSGLEKLQNIHYSEEEIEKYNLIIEEKIKANIKASKDKQKNKGEKQYSVKSIVFLTLSFGFFAFALYNFIKFEGKKEIKYKIGGAELLGLSYQDNNTIYRGGLTDKKKCQAVSNDQAKLIECLKSLESNIYYYNKPLKNVRYNSESNILTFDCDFQPAKDNSFDIKIDPYGNKSYRQLDTKVIKLLPTEEVQTFQNRLLEYGQCTYILYGIKDAYSSKVGNLQTQTVIPVRLDFYLWLKDDLSILYYQDS
jgi:hypothetical protein